jgi:TrkA domain protein
MSTHVEQVELPGIGTRSVFTTAAGLEVGVLTHHSGEKEILVYATEDPDRCASVVRLDPGAAHLMADLLSAETAADAAEIESDP